MTKKTNEGLIQVNIPAELQDTVLPSPYMLDYYRNLERRTLWIDSEIDEETLDIVRKIYQWNYEDDELETLGGNITRIPITIYINSPGGLLEISLAVAQCIKDSKTPVIGINIGECASGAALIFSQCHIRKAVNIAYFLIHKGATSGGSATYQQSKLGQKHYDRQIETMMNMLYTAFDSTKISRDAFEDQVDGEWYLYSNQENENKNQNALYLGFTQLV